MIDGTIPEIVTAFDSENDHFNNELYGNIIRGTLAKILPEDLFSNLGRGDRGVEEQVDHFHSLLPFMTWTVSHALPGNFSFFVVSRYRSNAYRFFFEMVTHWLVPGKRLNVVSLFAGDFTIPSLSSQLYTLCEVVVRIEDPNDLEYLHANLSTVETEIRLGLESSFYARRILEIKGVSADEKIALVQENITHLIRRLPQHFDYDLMGEMQHLFVMCKDEFKAYRQCKHLTRIITILYLFRKEMKEQLRDSPSARHVKVKIFRAVVNTPSAKKHVLGIIVGVNFIRDKEVFEKRHLLTAIRAHIPNVIPIEGSYITNRRGHESFCHLYVEIEKEDGQPFTFEEIRSLQRILPVELKDQIEHPAHLVFMPRNEEEIMRNVLILSSQIKFIRDIPQVVINFDEQTPTHLVFNIIFVQVVKPGSRPLKETLQYAQSAMEFTHERTKMVGFIRNKHTKEAVIFRVKIGKEPFFRRDHSIDLYKARQAVVQELSRLVGDFRDFNGGMIAKQNEILSEVHELLSGSTKYNEHLLENLYFSMNPPVMRTLIEPIAVKTLFLMLQDVVERQSLSGDGPSHTIHAVPDFVFVIIRSGIAQLRDEIAKRLNNLQANPSEIASYAIRVREVPYLGYVYRCEDEKKQALFCQAIENTLSAWSYKKTITRSWR